MEESLDKSKSEAILAFYNSFCDELKTELCNSLSDVRYLLHTVVDFIRNGKLEFSDHTNFGFYETVEFLCLLDSQLSEHVTVHLKWDLAEEGNVFEIAKILLALLYAIRLEQSKDMIDRVKQLSKKHHNIVAQMISRLDHEDFDGDREADVLASILAQIVPNLSNNSMANLSTISTCSPLTDIQNNPLASCMNADSKTPTSNALVNGMFSYEVFGNDSSSKSIDSPISYVVRSPRGKHIERIRQQNRKIADLERLVNTLEHEFENYKIAAESELKEKDLELASLRRKYDASNRRAMEADILQNELQDERNTDIKRAGLIEKLKGEIDRLNGLHSDLIRDRNNAYNRLQAVEECNRELTDSLATMRMELSDERSIGDFTKNKLSEAEAALSAWQLKYQLLADKHADALAEKERLLERKLSTKVKEYEEQLETAQLIQDQYCAEVSQLKANLAKAQLQSDNYEKMKAESDELQDELTAAEKRALDADALIGDLHAKCALLESAANENATRFEELNGKLEDLQEKYNHLIEMTAKTEEDMIKLSAENAWLSNRLDCDEVMRRYAASDSLFQTPSASSVIGDDACRYYTPRSVQRSRMSNRSRPLTYSPLTEQRTMDIFHGQEDDFLSQDSTRAENDMLIIEHSNPIESRHFIASPSSGLVFLNTKDNEIPSINVQTDSGPRSTRIGRVVKYVKRQILSTGSFKPADSASTRII